MEVRVSFMGELPAIVGGRAVSVQLPERGTVRDLLAKLCEAYGDGFACQVFSAPERLRHTMLVFVDGENIARRGGLAAPLGDGQVEVIMLPMFGGG